MRFLVFTMCVALAAMTSGGAWAQEEGATDRSGTDRSERAERAAEWRQRMLEEFDKDGDGVLDDEERAAMREAMRERRARGEGPRGEGFGGEGPRGPQPPVDFDRLFNRFDEDGDGQLSREEFGKLTEALQARLRGTPPAGRGEGRGPRGEGRGEGRGPRGEGRGEGRAEGRDDDRPGPPAGRRGGGRRPGAEPRDAEATEAPERPRGPRRGDGDAQAEGRGPGPGRMMNPERLFNRFDEDGDGQLSREEYDKFAEFMTEMRARMQERGPRGEAQEGRPGPPRGEGRGRPGRPQRPPQDEGASDAAAEATEDSDS